MNLRHTSAALIAALTLLPMAGPALAQTKLRIAVVTPLTGTLAAVNVPGQNAARMLAEAINAGTLPAPYNTGKGIGGQEIELIFLDENGGNAKQVAEFRGLAERRGADVVMGFGSAATCLAIAPVAGMPPKIGEAIFATPCATSSMLDRCFPPTMPSATTAESSDSIAASNAIVKAGPARSRTMAADTFGT